MENIKLPKNWHGVTIAQLLKIHSIAQDTALDEVGREVATVSVLSGLPEEEIERRYTLNDLKLFAARLNFLKDLPKENIPKAFFCQGTRYVLELEPQKLKGNQYADLTGYAITGDLLEDCPRVMAIISRPCKWLIKPMPYQPKDVVATAELFKHNLPVSIAYPVAVFFWTYYKSLIRITESYLEKAAHLTGSQKNTVG